MTSKLNSLIESGITAQQSGKLDEALACYQSALQLAPEDAEVFSLLGLALTQSNRLEEAEPLLRDAVAREPEQIGFRMNLTELLVRKGLLEEAKKEVTSIVRQNTGFSPGWERLGDIALLQEDKPKAKEDYKKAFSMASANFNIGLKLTELHIALEEFDQALNVHNGIVKQEPNNPFLLKFACVAMLAKHDWLQLESKAHNWARVSPNDPVPWQMLATAFMEQGRYRLAEEHYRNVLANRSENAEDLSVYGQICLQCFAYDKAKAALDRAEVLEPDRPDLLVSLSLFHTYFGEFEKAEDYCRRALQHDPWFAPAYTQLGHLTRGQFSDTEMDCLIRLKNDAEQAMEYRVDLAFTLGAAFETKEMYQSSYETYEDANRLSRDQGKSLNLRYNESKSAARTERIRALFGPDITQHPLDDAHPCPIFIVGMPRSGTTLIESTIAAHSTVFAGGERPLFPQIHNAALSFSVQNDSRLPPRDTLKDWARTYLSDLPDIGTANYFTDKNPLNIEAVGLIAVLFPNAPIVHIRRNPVETCFSIFKHKFSKFWSFAHSLSDIAHFYGQYAQLVSHWEQLLGDRFLTVQYEEFATNFSTIAPELIKHCGLEWELQCLDFQKENRAISTLSTVQVREPVKVSSGAAGLYQEYIGPLLEGLSSAGIDLDTGTLIEVS
jgi:tetratricopeptide (TPR) repeat protein